MKRTQSILFIVGIIFLFWISPSKAQSKTPTALKVACFTNATFSEVIDNEWRGASIDILRELEKRVAVKFNIIETPFKRLVHYMKQGKVDLSCPIFHLPEREKWASYLKDTPAYQIQYSLFLRNSSSFKYNGGTEVLFGKRIAKARGLSIGEAFDKAAKEKKFKLYETGSIGSLIQMLIKKRVDIIIASHPRVILRARSMNKENLIRSAKIPYLITNTYFTVSKNSKQAQIKEITKKLNKALQEMKRSRFFINLEKKYPYYTSAK